MKRKLRPEVDYTGWTKEQHIEHLKKERAYFKHYEKIDSTDIDKFIEEYATLKTELYEKREEYASTYERHTTQFLVKADEYIDKILQKKLFNLQCKWRANLIQLPLIHIIDDFDYWQEHIRDCPFIAPITEREIEICMRFLNEEIDWDDNNYQFHLWQNYDGIKYRIKYDNYSKEEKSIYGMSGGCNEDDVPKIYEFFDKHQNTRDLMFLEDVRGPIEDAYMEKSEEIGTEIELKKIQEDPVYEAEMYDYDENGLQKTMEYYVWLRSLKWEKFVERAEDQQTRELFKQSEYVNRKQKRSMYFERATVTSLKNDTSIYFDFLQEFHVELPIESNDNWRIAIEKTARKFQQSKVAEILPYAYETYMLGFEDISHIPRLIAERVARNKYDTECKHYKYMIDHRGYFLDGREALTGKRDFDYL